MSGCLFAMNMHFYALGIVLTGCNIISDNDAPPPVDTVLYLTSSSNDYAISGVVCNGQPYPANSVCSTAQWYCFHETEASGLVTSLPFNVQFSEIADSGLANISVIYSIPVTPGTSNWFLLGIDGHVTLAESPDP